MRIRPILGHAALPSVLQETQGVLHVAIEQVVVFNHGANTGVDRQGHAQRPQSKTGLASELQQTQRHRRQQQALQQGFGNANAKRDLFEISRCLLQHFEQIQADTAQQNLRIHKARHQVKQLLCATPRDPTRQGVAQGPLVKLGAGIQAFKPLKKTVMPCRHVRQGVRRMGDVRRLSHGRLE